MKKKRARAHNPHYDPATRKINELLIKIPKFGSALSRLYLWRYMMFNFMIVGATGTILSFLLYEGILRRLMIGTLGASFLGQIFPWAATFLGMVITTILVFLWNYFWNRHWSLSIDAQLISMKKGDLIELQEKIIKVLKTKTES